MHPLDARARHRAPTLYTSALLAVALVYPACGNSSSGGGGGGPGGTGGDAGGGSDTGGAQSSGGNGTGANVGTGGAGNTAGQGGGGGEAPVRPLLFRSNVDGNHIWAMDTDGGNRLQITTQNSNGFSQLSPDGTTIVFDRNIGGDIDVWTMNADGSNQVNLTAGVTENDAQATWSSDGLHLTFVSRRGPDNPSNRLGLYRMTASGQDVERLFLDVDVSVQHPYWRGSNIAFSYAGSGKWDIWLKAAADTEAGTNLTEERYGDHTRPVISPNGEKILFVGSVSDEDADLEIFIMDADGDNVEQLTDNEVADNWPAFSPDGTEVLYASQIAGSWDIWKMKVDGSDAVNLTEDLDESDEIYPSWGEP